MHRASYYEVGPYTDSPSTLQGSWVGASETKKNKKSWGERLRLGGGTKEDRKSREKEMALELMQNKYYLQEYRDRYGSVSPAAAATILQEGPPGGPLRFSNHPWAGYGSIAVRHPQLLLHQPPSRIPTYRGEEEALRPVQPVPPPSASPMGPRVLCPCGGVAEKGTAGPRSRKKGALRSKGCVLCGGGGTVRLPSKGVTKEGTVAARGPGIAGSAKPGGGTIQLTEAGRRPALEGLFAASTAGAATIPTARTTFDRSAKAPAPAVPAKPKVDPYDVMRRTRLVRPPESNSIRVRSKSSSPNRGRRNKRRMWGVREWPSEGEEEEDSDEEGLLGWEEDEDDRDEGAGRKSILECEVSAYELLSKYLKKGEAREQEKKVAKDGDEVLSMDDLSDELSDNALEDKPRDVVGKRSKGLRSEMAINARDRKVKGVKNGLQRVSPEGYGSEGEDARPTRPPRRSRTPAKDSRCLPLHSAPPPPPPLPPPLPPPPPPPPKRPEIDYLPQSTIKSILKKTAISLPITNSDPLVTISITSDDPQPPQQRSPAQEVYQKAKKDSTKKQVQFKATHDVVTVPSLMEEEGAEREEMKEEEMVEEEGVKEEEIEGEDRGEAEGVEVVDWEEGKAEEVEEDDGHYEDVDLPSKFTDDPPSVKVYEILKDSADDNANENADEEREDAESLFVEECKKKPSPPSSPVLRKIQSEILIGTENVDLCRTNALRHSLDERPEPGRERSGRGEGDTKAGATLFNDTMRLRLKVHRPQARRVFTPQSITPRPRMLSPPPRPREPPPPPPPPSGSSSPTDERKAEDADSPQDEQRLPPNPPPPAPPRQIFPFTPDEIARINGEGRRWSGRQQQHHKDSQTQRPSRPLSWSPASGRDPGAVTVLRGEPDRTGKQVEELERGREGKKVRTVVTLGGWKDTQETSDDSSDLKWRVLVDQHPRKTSILISGEPQVINRRDDNTLTISVAGGGGGVSPCGVYVATEEDGEGKEEPPEEKKEEDEPQTPPPLPSTSPPACIPNQNCFLEDPVEAVRRNLVPHVCGKSDDIVQVKEAEEAPEKEEEEQFEDAREACEDEEREESIGEVTSEGTIEDTVVGSIGAGSNEGDEEDVQTVTEKSPTGEDEDEEEDDHYEAVGEPIYEEIGESKEEKSIFEGASKYDILSYLVGARARGIPLDSEFDSLGLEEDLMEVEDFEEEDEEDLVIPLSLRNVGCRASHLSDSSEDSRATPSPLASMHGNSTITAQDKRRSSAEIERNDSGVGSETSKSSRSRWQQQQSKIPPPSSDTSSSASTLSSSASTHSSCSSSNGRVAGRVRVLAEEDEKEDEATEGLLSGDEAVVSNAERHLCEDCDQPVETQVTDGGLMFAPLVCRKCGKRRSERREIIAEIVETEAKYGRDLRILLEEFERPMRVAGLLSPDQLAGIFLNTEELATASSVLVSRLRDALEIAIESGDEDLLTVNVGRVFLDAAPTMLHAFQSYCTRQGAASVLLSNLEKEKELLRVFLRVSQMENAVLRRMNLNSFLMVPVQRVTKYPLLLGRLFKVTPPHAEGRELIRQAQRKIELHLEHMNAETKDISTIRLWRRISIMNGTPFRRSNSETDMQNIRLKKMALDVLEWNPDEVRFPVEGKLHYTQPTDSKWRKGQTVKLAPVNALLVTHGKLKVDCHGELTDQMLMFPRDTGIKEAALLLVKEKCNRYSLLREPLFLDRCIICKEMDWDDCFEVQELSTKDTYIFKGDGMEVTRQWYQELQYHALGLGPWRKRRNALANIMINSMARSSS